MTRNPTSLKPDDPVHIDQLQAALFYLMTQYSFSRCPTVAEEIVDQLNLILQHPHMELMPKQRSVLSGLLNHWRMHREIRVLKKSISPDARSLN